MTPMAMRVLAGDVGGTHARLAVVEVDGDRYEVGPSETFPSGGFDSLESIVEAFVDGHDVEVQRACVGVAGPVRDGRARTTNLPWSVASARLAASARVETAAVINDVEAQAYGIETLRAEDLVVLLDGDRRASGNRALISAGTGLGQAGLYWDGQTHRPFACEGGHATLAPRGPLQIALVRFLERRFGHVSWERALSGPGLVALHDFLVEHRGENRSDLHPAAEGEIDPETVTECALAGSCPVCEAALDLLVEIYGAEAGNLALKMMATGGLYVGGGLAPGILPRLRAPLFARAFLDKGRMRPLLEAVPVRVVVNDRLGLLGAARYAAHFAER